MPTLTELVADLPLTLPAKLRVLRVLSRTGFAQQGLRAWTVDHPEVVTGPDWCRRAWWGLTAGEVVREHLFDSRRHEEAIALVDDGGWSREIDDARSRGGVVLVTAHVGPPKLLMNVLLARSLPLLIWTNTSDMPPWLRRSTTATLLDPRVAEDRAALLVRSALHVRRGGVLLGAADFPSGSRIVSQQAAGRESNFSLGLPALCRRLGVPAFFVVALWRGNRVRIESALLEVPDSGLTDEEWNRAWVERYAACMERASLSGPENMRMLRSVAGGGLLRAVGVGGARQVRRGRPT